MIAACALRFHSNRSSRAGGLGSLFGYAHGVPQNPFKMTADQEYVHVMSNVAGSGGQAGDLIRQGVAVGAHGALSRPRVQGRAPILAAPAAYRGAENLANSASDVRDLIHDLGWKAHLLGGA